MGRRGALGQARLEPFNALLQALGRGGLEQVIAAMFFGGGWLVVTREGLIKVSFRDTKPVEGEYPADVVEMVPEIAKLKPNARKSLRHLLEKPDATAEVLTSIDKLAERNSSDQKDRKS